MQTFHRCKECGGYSTKIPGLYLMPQFNAAIRPGKDGVERIQRFSSTQWLIVEFLFRHGGEEISREYLWSAMLPHCLPKSLNVLLNHVRNKLAYIDVGLSKYGRNISLTDIRECKAEHSRNSRAALVP